MEMYRTGIIWEINRSSGEMGMETPHKTLLRGSGQGYWRAGIIWELCHRMGWDPGTRPWVQGKSGSCVMGRTGTQEFYGCRRGSAQFPQLSRDPYHSSLGLLSLGLGDGPQLAARESTGIED